MSQSDEGKTTVSSSAKKNDGQRVQAETGSDNGSSESMRGLRQASDDLKGRIAEAKRQHDMPLDSALGNPAWEERAADGRFDLPDEDEDA
jgi:hypothetical protein